MYCRTCGNKMNDNAEICVKCGVRKNVGIDFCQVCGTRTTAEMAHCGKCGAKLMKAMSSSQAKKKAATNGKKALGIIFLIVGLILVIATLINIGVVFTTRSRYGVESHTYMAIRCAILSSIFLIVGRMISKKK